MSLKTGAWSYPDLYGEEGREVGTEQPTDTWLSMLPSLNLSRTLVVKKDVKKALGLISSDRDEKKDGGQQSCLKRKANL